MATRQPKWKLLKNLGDVSPEDYGGYFVYEDETGEYAPEAEYLQVPPEDCPTDEGESADYTVYRFPLDKCKIEVTRDAAGEVREYLVPASYAPDWPHPVHSYDEWFHKDLEAIAFFAFGASYLELRDQLCSEDPIDRAFAYRAIGEYHGFDNLDSYPLHLTRAEVLTRYEADK